MATPTETGNVLPLNTGRGLVPFVPEGDLQREEEAARLAREQEEGDGDLFESELAAHIRKQFDLADWHRRSEDIEEGHLSALRAIRGEYDPEKLAAIEQFQGSKVYSRLTAVKCRGASAILRDIYLNGETPWELDPTPDPDVPGDIAKDIFQLIQSEVATMALAGQQVDPQVVEQRRQQLMENAEKAARKQAKRDAARATDKLNDLLTEGGFYNALVEFLTDLPIFLFACIKGPVVRQATRGKWQPDGTLAEVTEPKMFWYRVSPMDIWFAPGASDIRDGPILERIRLSRDELYDLIGLPGYNEEAIREVLERDDTGGLNDWRSTFEAERADLEKRENPFLERDSALIDTLEFHGYLRGKWLRDWGMSPEDVPDEQKEYHCTAWLIDRHVLKVHINPNPRKRPIYYVTSFEKVPGSLIGHGLPNILHDLQEVANATLRSLVNNLSIASGPQVIVYDEMMAPGADTDSLYPWKRWHVSSDVYNNTIKPVDFYQPNSHAQELLVVYEKFTQMADEISAIPRYLTGSERVGGAASTASGLSMLMNNASKVMQMVAANIDNDIIGPVVEQLYDMVMLTSKGVLRGDERITVNGVTNAVQREQDRVRQLEFLNITANPIDMQIVGLPGRAAVLRKVSSNLGLDYENVVPDDEQLAAALAAMQQQGDGPGPADTGENAAPHLNTQGNARSTVG